MLIKFIIAASMVLPFFVFASIEEVNALANVEHFKNADEKTLIIFDIDDTLTISQDPAFQRPYFKKYRPSLEKAFKDLSKEQQFVFANLALIDSSLQLIENETPQIVKELQKKGVKIIALTAAMSGKLQGVSLEDKRYLDLQKVNLDFSFSFPEISSISFTELKAFDGRHPHFYKGIILANGDFRKNKDVNSKGDVLLAFLKRIDWVPNRIFFVDDKRENLEFAEESLRDFNPDIQFIGLHYLGAQNLMTEDLSQEKFEKRWEELAEFTKRYKIEK